METKTCSMCNKVKPVNEFAKKDAKRYRNRCKTCDSSKVVNRKKLKQQHQLEQVAKFTGKKCGICGITSSLVIDHDHSTGAVRGILCDRCNSAIGFLDDDKRRLADAIKYLENAGDYGIYYKQDEFLKWGYKKKPPLTVIDPEAV